MNTKTQSASPQPAAKQAGSTLASPAITPLALLNSRLGNAGMRGILQAKLTVSDPQDPFEQEADRVADHVMRMPDSSVQASKSSAPKIQRVCNKCEDELHRSEDSSSAVPAVDAATEGSINSLSSRGSALPNSVRSFMEPRFQADFSSVRLHNDAHAHELARSVNAKAFTVGHNVVFAAGQYAPETDGGRRLLAHELTHVVQQNGRRGEATIARRPNESESLPVVKKMSTEEALTVLHAELKASGGNYSLAAMDVIGATLKMARTVENARLRLRRLIAAFSLLDRDDAAAVLHALTVPKGDKQKLLSEGFQSLDHRFRRPLLEILSTPAPQSPAATKTPPPQKWVELKPGVVAYKANAGETLNSIATRLSDNPHMPELLEDLNGGDRKTRLQEGQLVFVAFELVNRTDAIQGIPETLRQDIGSRMQAERDHAAYYRFAKVRTSLDPLLQKQADFITACKKAGPYLEDAVKNHAGQFALGLLKGLLDFVRDAAIILAISTTVGAIIGAIAGGGVGAIPGAEVGFEIGLVILEYYGLAMLIQAVVSVGGALFGQLAEFFRLFWNANGNERKLELAGRALAEALGVLVEALLIVVLAYLTKKGADALRNSRFAKTVGESRLGEWFKARTRFETTKALRGIPPEPVRIRGEKHEVKFEDKNGRTRACLCTDCQPIADEANSILARIDSSHPAYKELKDLAQAANEADAWVDGATAVEEGQTVSRGQQEINRLKGILEHIQARYPELLKQETSPNTTPGKATHGETDSSPGKEQEATKKPGQDSEQKSRTKVVPDDLQSGVKEALARAKAKLNQEMGEARDLTKDLDTARQSRDALKTQTQNAPRGSTERAKHLEDFDAAKKHVTELEGQSASRAEVIRKTAETIKRLQQALDKATYDRVQFTQAERLKVWEASKDQYGKVRSPSGVEIKSFDEPWIMGHKPKYEYWKHARSAAERGITREQFIKEYKDLNQYRPETPTDSSSHAFEDKTDAYLGH